MAKKPLPTGEIRQTRYIFNSRFGAIIDIKSSLLKTLVERAKSNAQMTKSAVCGAKCR